MHGRHFESGSLFELFLDSFDFLFFRQSSVVFNFAVTDKSRRYYAGYRTALFFAEGLSTGDVAFFQSYLYSGNEFVYATFTFYTQHGDETLYRKNDYRQQQGLQNRHDETTFIDCTQQVQRMAARRIAAFKVFRIAKYLGEYHQGNDKTDNDYNKCVFYTAHLVLFSFFSFHN